MKRTKATKIPGVILFEGPSRIDGKPIVVVATFVSKNDKTGNMIQTWILRSDIPPLAAINSGEDVSVCGNCPLRGFIRGESGQSVNHDRGCYVTVRNAPRSIWEAYKRGNYPKYDAEQHAHLFKGRKLRLGAYGDPVAAPLRIWKPIMLIVSGRTGYTHQWRKRKFRPWAKYIMASTHTVEENELAKNYGFRWFRSGRDGELPVKGEFVCPASEAQGKRLACEECCACKGGKVGQVSVFIPAHGSLSVLSSFNRVTAS